jgi:hypothetical protein
VIDKRIRIALNGKLIRTLPAFQWDADMRAAGKPNACHNYNHCFISHLVSSLKQNHFLIMLIRPDQRMPEPLSWWRLAGGREHAAVLQLNQIAGLKLCHH